MRAPISFAYRIALVGAVVGCGPGTQDPEPSGSTSEASNGSTGDDDDGVGPGPGTSIGMTAGDDDPDPDSTGGGGLSQTAACAGYLTCAAAATPAELGALLEAYGPEGTCWQSTPEVAEQCDMACMAGLAQLQEAFCDEPACGAGGGSCSPDSTGGGEPGPPMIVSVSWTNVPGCAPGTGSDVDFVIDVVDSDHDRSELVFTGIAIGCSGAFDTATPTLFCPNAARYSAEVQVADPDGNEDSIQFTFSPCVDDTAP